MPTSSVLSPADAPLLTGSHRPPPEDRWATLRHLARTIRRSHAIPFGPMCRMRYELRKQLWGGTEPKTYLQKINWRLAFDRRPILRMLVDKVRVRDFIAARIGTSYLPKCHFVATRPEAIDPDQLPPEFVVKPNHGCGMIWFVTDRVPTQQPTGDPFKPVFTPRSELDRSAFLRRCHEWLSIDYSRVNYEWAYHGIPRRLLVEEYLHDASGSPAFDYKLIVTAGRVRAIQVDSMRFGAHRRGYFSRDWQQLPVRYVMAPLPPGMRAPDRLDEMITVAEKLGRDLDHVRVDTYALPDRVVVGELTIYHNAGCSAYDPPEFDLELGRDWKLPSI